MGRLFVGQREVDFFADITKEIIKDVAGQKIYYYTVRDDLSNIHDVYEESPEKIFDHPIEIECFVKYMAPATTTDRFGSEKYYTVEAYIQSRDLLDKGIEILEGDFFSYDDNLYEVLTFVNAGKNIFGLAEYNVSWKITARSARLNQLDIPNIPAPRLAPDDIQKVFEQQRGLPITSNGEQTGDVREMRERLGHDMAPISLGTGQRTVEPNVDENGDFIEGETQSFNNDPLPAKKGLYDE